MSLFTFFYYILALILWILAIPFLLFKSRNPKYKDAIPARFFLKDNSSFEKGNVWFHTCSMGEAKAIKPLVEKFDKSVISVITNTGFETASQQVKQVRYLPYELFLPFWITKQKVLVVMEAELWYMMFLSAHIKRTPTMLINARISDKSYESYKRFSFVYKQIFKLIDHVFAQSQIDKERLLELGAKKVEVIGNIKLANLPKKTKDLSKPSGIMITAASTHETEEELILDVYDPSMGRLVIVPRHPERFESVDALIQEKIKDTDITYHRYSQQNDFESDIILVDCMGELINIFAISDVVILGGAFANVGGHNPIEPAFFNVKLISGKRIFNQKSLFEAINDYVIIEDDELKQTLQNIDSLPQSSLQMVGDINPIIEVIAKYNKEK